MAKLRMKKTTIPVSVTMLERSITGAIWLDRAES
jgi:hypothetical protein